jgi:polysaccharide biosynthesis/export protein
MATKASWIVIAIFVTCCGQVPAQTIDSGSDRAGAAAQASEPPKQSGQNMPLVQERHPRYQVMPSDVLTISFPLIPELQPVPVTVQPDGFITLPNGGGAIYVKGDTLPQIVDILTKSYSTTMHKPIVNVDVTNFQPPLYTVNGWVGKPGQYPLRVDTTVSEGIAVAGGLLAGAKSQVFLLRRVSADWMEVKKLNLAQVLNGRNIHEDVHLQAGDMIYVPDKFITKFRQYIPYGMGSSVGWNGNSFLTQ